MKISHALLTLAFLVAYACAGTKTVTLDYTGGHCKICNSPGNLDYACSNGHGNWNGGVRPFDASSLSIPPGEVITKVEAEYIGVWGCNGPQVSVSGHLQNKLVGQKTMTGQCACGTCDPVHTMSQPDLNGWDNFNYNGLNSFQVRTHKLGSRTGVACVKKVVLTLHHGIGIQIQPPNPCDNHDCGSHGNCTVNQQTNRPFCDCELYWHGEFCSCFVPSHALITDHSPVLDVAQSGFLTKDTLHLHVNNSAKYYKVHIDFKYEKDNRCDYNQASQSIFWKSHFTQDQCRNQLVAQIPWADAWPNCVFDRRVVANWLEFEGEMILHNKEFVGGVGRLGPIERTRIDRLPFIVRFPRRIEVTGSKVLYDFPKLYAAIVKQVFETESREPGTADVELLTSLPKEYYLSLDSYTGPAGHGFGVGGSTHGQGACANQSTPCEQLWSWKISPDKAMCNINGDYQMKFTVKCRPQYQSTCPLGTDNKAQVDFTLESSNFCPQIIDDIDLSSTLQCYQDSGLTIEKGNFLEGQTVHFKATLSSQKATIVSTRVETIHSTHWDGTRMELLNLNGNTIKGTALGLQVNNGIGAAVSAFSYKLGVGVFDVNDDENDSVFTEAVVGVTYKDTSRRTFKIRSTGQSSTVTEVNFHVGRSGLPSSAPSLKVGLTGLAVASTVSTALVLVM